MITVQQIMGWCPCDYYTDTYVTALIGAGKSPRELAALEIPIDDRLWVLHRYLRSVSVDRWREYIGWCALRTRCYADAADAAYQAANAAARYAVAAYHAAAVANYADYAASYRADAAASRAVAAYHAAGGASVGGAAYQAANAAARYAVAAYHAAAVANYADYAASYRADAAASRAVAAYHAAAYYATAVEQQMQLAHVLELIETVDL